MTLANVLTTHAVLFLYIGVLSGLLVALSFESGFGASVLYWILMVINGLLALYVLAEAAAALIVRARNPCKASLQPFHQNFSQTVIIAAYLPNEKEIIVETINHFLNEVVWPSEYTVILAYNTPEPLPVESELLHLAALNRRFRPVCVKGSSSKAANVNYILQNLANKQSKSHIVSIFDADHRPYPDAFLQMLESMHENPDTSCFQGRCIIRNASESFVARMIEPEFDLIYNVFHVGFNAIHGHGLFGGSNGHWRAPAICSLLMDGSMLTEDIDLTVRALVNNLHVAFDHRIRSTEEAPATLKAYVKQRSRWAQGWFQITFHRALWAIRSSKHLSLQFGLFLFLIFRELSFHINAILSIQVIIGLARSPSINNYIWATVVVYALLLLVLLASAKNAGNAIIFWLLFFFYSFLQMYIVLVSEVKEFLDIAKWKVTQRTPALKSAHGSEVALNQLVNISASPSLANAGRVNGMESQQGGGFLVASQ